MKHFNFENPIEKTVLLESYYQDGIVVLENYLQKKELHSITDSIDMLKEKAEKDLETQWNNKKIYFYSADKEKTQDHFIDFAHHPYFLASKDASHLFYEKKEGYSKINRIGHALHKEKNFPALYNIIKEPLLTIFKMLNYVRPICQLSVYIPKYPNGIGSEVNPHQENTFAYTNPNSAMVLWIALDDATIENACMWGILGSNKYPLKYYSKVNRENRKRDFIKVSDVDIPDFNTSKDSYTPLEIKAGDALLFHGNFVHCSPINVSKKQRRCLSLQFIETANVDYPNYNWIWPCRTDYLYGETNHE